MADECILRAAVGEEALTAAYQAEVRAIHDRSYPRPDGACPDSHARIEYLIARGHLLTRAEAEAMLRATEAEMSGRVRDAQQMREMDRAHYEQAERDLAAVLALIDRRRKVVRMDDLRRAVGDHDVALPPAVAEEAP